MIEIDNQTDLSLPVDTLEAIKAHLSDKPLELLIVEGEQMRRINAQQRGIDKVTDVLSFPFKPSPMAPLGSIVICSDKVIQAAAHFSHTKEQELCLLFIHGLLHLLGYDHESDTGEMRQKESELITHFNLPPSLIVRTQE